MRKPEDVQLDLFGAPAPRAASPDASPDAPPDASPDAAHAVLPAELGAELQALARRLPPGIHLGTSSWHFPGWARLVYDRVADARTLAREGLAAYARHPLLRCVSLDRTFHAPIPESEFRRYARQVPEDFRFVVKAPMLCTAPVLRSHPGARPATNAKFLDPGFAADQFVSPCVAGLEEKAGALVFQFPPLGRDWVSRPRLFARRLHDFFAALPLGPRYAVELRDHALVGPDYLDAIHDVGVTHCLGLHPRMPVASEQARETGLDRTGPLIVRWNLHAGFAYEEAKARYAPFTRLVDEDILNRVGIARLALAAAARGQPVLITANNKAEGSAPLTVIKLAEQIVAAAAHTAAGATGPGG